MLFTIERVVGDNVRRLRERRQLTQAELGKRVAVNLGASPDVESEWWSVATVSAAENGARGFSASDLTALAVALDVQPGTLLVIPEQVAVLPPGKRGGERVGESVDAVRIGAKIGGKGAGEGGRDYAVADVQRLATSLDPDSPMEYVKEIGRDVDTWRDQAGEIAEALRGLATTIAKHAERAQGLSDRADDIHDLAMTARVQMLRYVQGSTPEIESTEG